MEGERGSPQEASAVLPKPARSRWRTCTDAAIVAAALVHPMATLAARYDWRADLFTHFQGLAVVTTLVAGLFLIRRRRRLALGLGALAICQILPLFRFEGPNPVKAHPSSTVKMRVLMSNVLCENENYHALAQLIREENPDVVGLVEYSLGWSLGLDEIRQEYPYRVEAPRGARGVALWFRERPVSIDPPQTPLLGGWPYLHATFELGGRLRHLWLIHPSSPFHRRGLPELSALAEQIRDVGGSAIVVGDMNSSEGSPRFADFLRVTGLRDSRFGFGRQTSWPLWLPYRIAIDHAFIASDIAVVDRRLGPDIGSDHAPLILDLAPAADSVPVTNSASPSKSK